jgi:hypothetical protein
LEGVAMDIGGTGLTIGVLENNHDALCMLRTCGFTQAREFTWRMVLGEPGILGLSSSLYAINSPFTG